MSPEFRAPSNGPTTEEGKRVSSQNAVRHGLFDHYLQSFDPQGPVEMDTVGELASTYWRMRRLWTIETTLMNEQLALQSPHDAHNSHRRQLFHPPPPHLPKSPQKSPGHPRNTEITKRSAMTGML
jgi:hypothetical protein